MTDKPARETSFVDEAILRQSLRMKATFLELIALTIGAQNVNASDFAFMDGIDAHCSTMAGRYRQHSISGNPPMSQPGTGDRFHEEHPEPAPLDNEGAQNFAAGIAEQLREAPITDPSPTTAPSVAERWNHARPLDAPTAVPAPPPPAAPVEEPPAPLGDIDPEIAAGISELSEDDAPQFDAKGVRNRGHVIR